MNPTVCSFVKVKLGKEGPFEETSESGRQAVLFHSLFSPHEACQGKGQGCWRYRTCQAPVFPCDGQVPCVCMRDSMRNWAGGASRYLAVVAVLQL